jgi:MFS family permease
MVGATELAPYASAMPAVRGRFGALEERPFRLLWLGQTTSALGDALIPVALAFAVIQVGGGAAALGVVLATYTIARAAFILVGGVWADRLPRRFVMIAADVLRAVAQAGVAMLLLADAMEVWMFVVQAAVVGSAHAFFGPASTGLVPETVSRDRLQQANALLELSRSGIQIFGPAASGILIALTEPAWVFAIDSATFAVSAAFLAALRVAPRERPKQQRFLADLADGMREAWSRGWMRAGFGLAAIANVGLGITLVLGPLIAEEELGGAAAWGFVLTGGAIGGVVGSVVALRVRPPRPIMWSFIVWSLGSLPPLAFAPPLPAAVVAVAYGLFLFGIAYGNAVYEAVMQRQIPAERLARVSSFDWMVSIVFMPLGLALAGPLANAVGVDAVLVAAALLIIVSCAAGVATPSVRSLEATREPRPTVIEPAEAAPRAAPRG